MNKELLLGTILIAPQAFAQIFGLTQASWESLVMPI